MRTASPNWLISIVIYGFLLACPATAAPCTVEGVVVNAVTGEPLRKASVLLRGAPSDAREEGAVSVMAAVTDPAGRYSLTDVPPGRYRLIVERSGFVGQQLGASSPLILVDGAVLKDMNFRLTPQGVVTGRVLDEDGDPVQNAIITCYRLTYTRGRKQWVAVNSQSTNDLGEYRMHSLAPGKYVVSATYRTGPPDVRARGAEDIYAPTFYPGVAVAEMAAPLPVAAGGVLRGVDVPLRRTRTVAVRGKLISGAGEQEVEHARVRFLPRSDAIMTGGIGVRVYEDNTFLVSRVAPGSYWLMAENGKGLRMAARVPVDVGTGPIDNLAITLAPGPAVAGAVDGAGCPGFKASSVAIQLEADNPNLGWGNAPRAQAAADGSFTIRAVLPDRYVVRASGLPAGCYVDSIRFGDADATGLPFEIGATPPALLTVRIAGGAGVVDGKVEGDRQQPVGGATVVLVPEGDRRGRPVFYASGVTDSAGKFTLKGVVPGDYRAYAFERIEQGAYLDADFMKPFESAGERVTLRESGTETVTLRSIAEQP